MKSLVPIMSLSAASLLAGSAVAETSAIFKYSATNIPLNYGTCEEHKQRLSQALSARGDARVVSSNCETLNGTMTVEFTYATSSGRPLELTSTRDLDGQDIDGRGYMSTREECENATTAVVDKFITATGLNPFMVYCTQDKPAFVAFNPWHVAIDAFGVGRQQYFLATRLSASNISGDTSAYTQRVKDYFNARANTTLVDVRLMSDSMRMQRLVVGLFADSYVSLGTLDSVITKTSAECDEEAAAFGTAAAQAPRGIITYGCKANFGRSGHTPFVIYEGISREFLSVTDTGITFATMSDCKAKRDMTLRHLQEVVGTSVTGVLCDNSREKTRAFAVEIQSTP